jgi:hypothetical protein
MTCAAPNSCGRCQRTFPCMVGKCAWLIEEAYKVVLQNTSFLPDPDRQYDPAFSQQRKPNG